MTQIPLTEHVHRIGSGDQAGMVECHNECQFCQWQMRVNQNEIDRLKAVIKASVLALRGTPHPPDWSEKPTVEYVASVLEQAVK